jgi:hypothetical protein
VGNTDFEMIFAVENWNKFQKTKFWKEILVEDVVTLGPTAHATLVSYETIKSKTTNPKKKWPIPKSFPFTINECMSSLNHLKKVLIFPCHVENCLEICILNWLWHLKFLKLIMSPSLQKLEIMNLYLYLISIVTLHAIKLKSSSLKCFDLVFLSFKGNVVRIVTSSLSITKQMHPWYILTCKGVEKIVML